MTDSKTNPNPEYALSDNEKRLGRAYDAVTINYGQCPETSEEVKRATIDALTNIRHLCDQMDVDYDDCNATAEAHFRNEVDPYSGKMTFPGPGGKIRRVK